MNFLFLAAEVADKGDVYSMADWVIFFGFIAAVLTIGIGMSRQEKDSESYFLAGRGLSWWLIGFSLIAANISTEQFVGMSGDAARPVGLAIAGYEWLAAITLVCVAFFFLPKFLRAGVYTIPEFLETRYNEWARLMMSVFMVIMLVVVNISAVIYSGAKTVDVLFEGQYEFINIASASWIIGILAALYVLCGGLKACAWADLLQGSALIIGGAMILWLALAALDKAPVDQIAPTAEIAEQIKDASPIEKFNAVNQERLQAIRPADDPKVPWTALVLGLWIPNFYYWGLNQYIMQRTLGAKSLAEGQRGIVFAASLKLIIPFIVVFPGMMALNLYRADMEEEARTETNVASLARFEALTGESLADEAGVALLAPEAKDKATAELKDTKTPTAFKFDGEFAELYPTAAEMVYAYNTTLADIDVEEKESLAAKNAAIIEAIEKTNKEDKAKAIPIATEMIGRDEDAAFPLLIKKLVPTGLKGFMLAAIMGAVMSSLASMLNAASTICTMDLVKKYASPKSSERNLVGVGRAFVLIFAVFGCLIAPQLGHPAFKGIFNFIQEFQGFISPGILAIFLFGMFIRRAPSMCGVTGMLLSPVIYGLLMLFASHIAFLDRMAITFGSILVILAVITVVWPRKEKFEFTTDSKIELTSSPLAKVLGIIVVIATLGLYWYFRGQWIDGVISNLFGG